MPGRKETAVHSLFDVRESEIYKGKRAFCKFCFNDVADNGTRKTQHILNCMHCTEEIKRKFLGCDIQTTAKSHKRKQKDPKMEARQKMKGKLLFATQNLKLVAPVFNPHLHQPSSMSTTSYSKRAANENESSSSDTESQSDDSDMISSSSRIPYDDESDLSLEDLTRMLSDEPESE